jgi:spermidine/putrescine transport system ATP-binding protein
MRFGSSSAVSEGTGAVAAAAKRGNGPAVILRGLTKEFLDLRGQVSVTAVDDVSLEIREGEFFALLGPSGCGKTTTLRMIAGFEQPSRGEILLRGRPVQGIPSFHRPVNTVFQDYALFPHMSVLHNVQFGLRMAGVRNREARRRALEALDMVRLGHAAERKPQQLSGGQQQRVALARALVNRPAVLLLDEPLGALDLKLRKAMQSELKQLQQQVGITFIYVTHDQEEALSMADRIAVMDGGKALQVGRPEEIYERPTSRFVADFIGETNFLEGALESLEAGVGRVRLPSGEALVATVHDPELSPGAAVAVAIRPEKLDLRRAGEAAPTGSFEVTELPSTVTEVNYIGTDTRYTLRLDGGGELVARIQNQHHGFDGALAAGERVLASWPVRHASVLR